MQAKAKTPYPVTAFTGREFVPYEWRDIPAGSEDEARRNPFLILRDDNSPPPPDAVEVDATDAARALAAEHGIDLAAVEGSGENGRVLVSDVRAMIAAEEEE